MCRSKVKGRIISSLFNIEIKHEKVNAMNKETASKRLTIEQVKEKHENRLLNISGVQGVGIGEESGKSVIMIYVDKKTKSLIGKIPTQIEGYPVKIEVSGEFHALPV